MKKILLGLLLVSVVFARAAIAAEEASPPDAAAGTAGIAAGTAAAPAGPEASASEALQTQTILEVQGDFEGTVTRVFHAGMIEINGMRMHLLGVLSPLRTTWGRAIDCYSDEAATFLESLVKGEQVTYSYDRFVGRRDRHGQRRIYLYKDGKLINAELIEQGYAFANPAQLYRQKDLLLLAQAKARRQSLHVWHSCPVECDRHSGCRTKLWEPMATEGAR
jgi:endonuclease YncB( thermonuclease family)